MENVAKTKSIINQFAFIMSALASSVIIAFALVGCDVKERKK